MFTLYLKELKMIVRKARIEDASRIAEHLFLAMEDIIYEFIGIKDTKLAKEFLHFFVQKENNQYSYQNCLVVESTDGIEASINVYNGAKLDMLRNPIIKYVRAHFNPYFNPEKETQAGEYYIDSFGVNPNKQGKGIGTKLLKAVIEQHTHKLQVLGLLVDENNPNAERLYLSLGFKIVGSKVVAGKKLKHLQLKPTNKE